MSAADFTPKGNGHEQSFSKISENRNVPNILKYRLMGTKTDVLDANGREEAVKLPWPASRSKEKSCNFFSVAKMSLDWHKYNNY